MINIELAQGPKARAIVTFRPHTERTTPHGRLMQDVAELINLHLDHAQEAAAAGLEPHEVPFGVDPKLAYLLVMPGQLAPGESPEITEEIPEEKESLEDLKEKKGSSAPAIPRFSFGTPFNTPPQKTEVPTEPPVAPAQVPTGEHIDPTGPEGEQGEPAVKGKGVPDQTSKQTSEGAETVPSVEGGDRAASGLGETQQPPTEGNSEGGGTEG